MGIGRNTVTKFAAGDPAKLSETGLRIGKLDPYIDDILTCLHSGKTKKETLELLQKGGYTGGLSNTYEYFKKIEGLAGKEFVPHPYMRTKTAALGNKAGSIGEKFDFITRNGVFQFLWLNGNLTQVHKDYIFHMHPILYEIQKCIQNFRHIYKTKSMPFLYLFIEEYAKSDVPSLKSFAVGLKRDIVAVENSVASDLSNGFVEGTNSKLKMVKRTMYGRCNIKLLSAKLMLRKPDRNG